MAVAELTLRPVAERITGAATLGRHGPVGVRAWRGRRAPPPASTGSTRRSPTRSSASRAASDRARADRARDRAAATRRDPLLDARRVDARARPARSAPAPSSCPSTTPTRPRSAGTCWPHSAGARSCSARTRAQVAKIDRDQREPARARARVVIDGEAAGAITLVESLRRRRGTSTPEDVEQRVRRGRAERHRDDRLHLGHDRPAEGLRADARELARRRRRCTGASSSSTTCSRSSTCSCRWRTCSRAIAQIVVLDVGGTLVYWRGDAQAGPRGGRRGAADALRRGAADLREAAHRRARRRRASGGPHARLLFAWALEVGRRARTGRARRAGRWAGSRALRLRLAERARPGEGRARCSARA